MPRTARIVVPGVAHHVTQRGTDRQVVFHTRNDRRVYLRLLRENSEKAGLQVLAYCLMPNHIHLVVIPEEEDSMAVALRRVHGRYAQYANARRLRSGHLWQNRFYSCALDGDHLRAALSYVERNPVRAGMVASAEDYEWSSAAAHLTGRDPHFILNMGFWKEWGGVERWAGLLCSVEVEAQVKLLKRATYSGKPLGSREFLEELKQRREENRTWEGRFVSGLGVESHCGSAAPHAAA